jgi:hypothetical protein
MTQPFKIECDSSDFAVGAVLLQQDAHKRWRPIAYESKKLSSTERNYPTQERELLAILMALRTWRCFIDGGAYTIITDHKPLTHLRGQKKVTPRLVRWIAELELYNPVIEYKKGIDNTIPDLLSRRDGPTCTPANTSMEPKYLYGLNNNSTDRSKRQISADEDPIHNWPSFYFRDEQEWPDSLKEVLQKNKSRFEVADGSVYKLHKIANTNEYRKLRFIPFAKRADLIDDYHSGFGHSGQANVYELMKSRVWWPYMQDNINLWLSKCPRCQLNKNSEKMVHHAPMRPLDIPPPFSRWHLDFIGELPLTKNNNRWILIAVDYATNWPIMRALPNATGEEIVKFIYEEIVLKFGNPMEIFTDRGANFMSKVMKQYMIKIKSKHTLTSAYHPRSNSKCERTNQIIKSMLKKYVNGHVHSWDEFIDTTIFACRIRKHRTTGYSPFFLVYGIEPNLPGDPSRPFISTTTEFDQDIIAEDTLSRLRQLREKRFEAEQKMILQGKKDKEKWDEKLKGNQTQIFDVGNYVLLRHESKKGLEFSWQGPYIIEKRNLDFNTYKIKEIDGKSYSSWVHTDRLQLVKYNDHKTIDTTWYIPREARKL